MIPILKYDREKYKNVLRLTEDEENALEAYQRTAFASINELLINDNGEYSMANIDGKGIQSFIDIEESIEFTMQGMRNNGHSSYFSEEEREKIRSEYEKRTQTSIMRTLKLIPHIYSAMLKSSAISERKKHAFSRVFNRGTTKKEIDSYENGGIINNPMSTSSEKLTTRSHFLSFAYGAKEDDEPVCLEVEISSDIPFIYMKRIAGEEEVLISPFTQIKSIKKGIDLINNNSERKVGSYRVSLEAIELQEVSNDESDRLREDIFDGIPEVSKIMTNMYTYAKDIKHLKEKISIQHDIINRNQMEEGEKEYRIQIIADCQKEIKAEEEEISSKMHVVREWKSKVIRLTMSECKKKEIEITSEFKKEEVGIEKKEKMQELYDSLNRSLYRQNIKVNGGHGISTMVDVLEIDERIRTDISKIDGFKNDTSISKYYSAISGVAYGLTRMDKADRSIDNQDEAYIIGFIKCIEEGGLSDEILELMKLDQSYLKQRVFDRLESIIVEAEKKSLKAEAIDLHQKNQKKGLARLFGGLTKSKLSRMNEIDEFLNSINDSDEKSDRNYSERKIIAEIEMFCEDHENDEIYINSITEVQKLKAIINNNFSYSRDDVDRIKQQRREQEETNGDSRMSRIIRIKADRSTAPIIHQTLKAPKLSEFKKFCDKVREKTENLEKENDVDIT